MKIIRLAKEVTSPMPGLRRLKLPIIECAHEARPAEEMTPERVAEALFEEEPAPHRDAAL